MLTGEALKWFKTQNIAAQLTARTAAADGMVTDATHQEVGLHGFVEAWHYDSRGRRDSMSTGRPGLIIGRVVCLLNNVRKSSPNVQPRPTSNIQRSPDNPISYTGHARQHKNKGQGPCQGSDDIRTNHKSRHSN